MAKEVKSERGNDLTIRIGQISRRLIRSKNKVEAITVTLDVASGEGGANQKLDNSDKEEASSISPSSSLDANQIPKEDTSTSTASTMPDEVSLRPLLSIEDPLALEEAAVKLFTDWPLAYLNSNIPDAKMHYWDTTSDPKTKMMTKSHGHGQPGGWFSFPPLNLKHSVAQLGLIPSIPYRIPSDLVESGPNINFDASETISECDEVSDSVDLPSSFSYVPFTV